MKNNVEIASHPSDARNDSKKYLIFKWLYQLLDSYRYFWVCLRNSLSERVLFQKKWL
ncbi:hypothetical protein [Thermodesulfovibrio hydrogeniphilus]